MSDTTPSHGRRPVLEQALQEFLDARAGKVVTDFPELPLPTAADARNTSAADAWDAVAADGRDDAASGVKEPDDPCGTATEWLALPCGPTGRVHVQVTRPVGAAEPSPVVLFLSGLGWSLGDAASYGRLIREFALGTDAAVVYVDYTRAPAAHYPVAVEQCYAAARWIQAHGREIGLEGGRMAAVGDSAGANLVAALTLLARQRGDLRLVHQVLLCPVTDADFDTPSYHRYATGYFLHRDHMRRFWDAYLPEVRRRREATAAPLRATPDQLTGLPPALVVTAEADVLRDEGEAYAARLRAAGVPVVATRYQGAVHGFLLLDALFPTSTARAALIQAVDTVHVALHRRSW
ncbi:alpha/beta hydrolase [Kitasatospora sp. RB6PN24]|uniref:alpha/beta hydrolase n=1 Tax=Kitasatospora humi TaxID=2893891 RepID=UPI001E4C58F0|nr:alpha/beta hydrolase [Kitasatospora humi]MCC9311463.1 alpha/beta hydrolase [Kitasatospora humi]